MLVQYIFFLRSEGKLGKFLCFTEVSTQAEVFYPYSRSITSQTNPSTVKPVYCSVRTDCPGAPSRVTCGSRDSSVDHVLELCELKEF